MVDMVEFACIQVTTLAVQKIIPGHFEDTLLYLLTVSVIRATIHPFF